MFDNRFAYEFQGNGEEGHVPPWHRHGGHGPRFFGEQHRHGPFGHHRAHWGNEWTPPWFQEQGPDTRFFAMGRGRGPFGFGGRFGPGGGPFGPGREGGRFFGRGDMKYALLWLLQERPMHGYEMIKALEQRSGGFYSPSPGSIYPTLQMLEEGGYATGNEVEGKKVYTITDTGRALLTDSPRNEEGLAGPPWMRWHGHGGHASRPEMHALAVEAREVARLFAIATRASFENPEQVTRLRGIIERTRGELNLLIAGESTTPAADQPATPNVDQA
ncbi:MAG: PadR family transcriptional regulator [Ktedonobacteraceae bacterium]